MKINKIYHKLANILLLNFFSLLFVRLARLSTVFIPPGCVTPGVLPQVIFPVKRTTTLYTSVPFLACVHHLVQGQLLLALERFAAHRTGIRPFRTMALPMSRQVVLTLQPCTTNVAHKSPFRRVCAQVFLQQMLVQVFGPAFRTPEHGGAICAARYPYLAGLRLDLRRRRRRRSRRTAVTGGCCCGDCRCVHLSALFSSLLWGFRLIARVLADGLTRVLEEVVQGERGRQMRQVIGHGRPGRSDALP